MPPRLRLRPVGHGRAILKTRVLAERQSICCFCSLSSITKSNNHTTTTITTTHGSARRTRKRALLPTPRREESTFATPINTSTAHSDPRRELESVLLDLQKHAANYVNLSRLQLALNGLRQKPGTESIRVAVLGLTNASSSRETAKQVLKLLLADPLKDAEDWEREVEEHDLAQPMIIRVGAEVPPEHGAISLTRGNLLHEVNVSSATLNGHNLELLLMETNPFVPVQGRGIVEGFEDSVLVPTVDIPTSSDGRYSPITTPVHKALIVADGILGAASVVSMPTLESRNVLAAAVNMPEYKPAEKEPLPFTPIDIGTADIGLRLVRKNLSNAIEFEHLWFQSNLPKLVEWLKADILTVSEGTTKPPVRELIASLLRSTSMAIQTEENKRLSSSASSSTSSASLRALRSGLEDWAENAHAELQEQLDIAFSSGRWRKLGWWKLFWRVDDVGMLTTDILSQRFLPHAERSAIFLAGRMKEAGILLNPTSEPLHPMSPAQDLSEENGVAPPPLPPTEPGWPVNIPITRRYLQTETIPDLQALAQRLVLQTLSTSGLTTALGALAYVGTLTTTLYEAGAVAALGIVWSMKRMQASWEAAREVWEGEVREEGRKAVRGVEGVMGKALREGNRGTGAESQQGGWADELERIKGLVMKARELLQRMK
ncbi:hypothetical protein F4775DRAFT_563382 [Biscogniauxia sp. FL1348]|nr:hypothetical protein F4775DRAFT_563382 [Biscogniauxia sp. FL1348]